MWSEMAYCILYTSKSSEYSDPRMSVDVIDLWESHRDTAEELPLRMSEPRATHVVNTTCFV